MGRLCRHQSIRVVAALVFLLALLSNQPAWTASDTAMSNEFYDRPVLTVDPGMHTAIITSVAVDAASRFLVTGALDKTVRIWSVADGQLLQTIRVPAGLGNVGKIYAVAMRPDGDLVAAGGWTSKEGDNAIYLFDRSTGVMARRISNLPNAVFQLVFSADGRYLAATLGGAEGLRIYDRETDWAEVARDGSYDGPTYGAAFAGDGRLATASFDGKVRLYDQSFRLVYERRATTKQLPRKLAFSPDGVVLALSYQDGPLVDLMDGRNLAPQRAPDTDGIRGGNLAEIAWSKDGRTLFAAGTYGSAENSVVLSWAGGGRRKPRAFSAGISTVTSLASISAGRLVVATADPYLAVLEADGSVRWAHQPPQALFLGQAKSLAVSADATVVDFGFAKGEVPLRFDAHALKLTVTSGDDRTVPPRQVGLPIQSWYNSDNPTLGRNPIDIGPGEISRSLAIHPTGERFVLGTNWTLHSIDARGRHYWKHNVPGEAWAVNITGDGRIVVAAYGDGTIRWHRMDDGRELLALMVLGDRKNWAAWTPEGFYAATPGAHGLLQFHVNRGNDAAAQTVPLSTIPKLRRPDAIPLVIQELETDRAIGLADLAAERLKLLEMPRARLHVLTIGISDYGERARHLRLAFAAKDARDVASALANTQGSTRNGTAGLYTDVLSIHLEDKLATKGAIAEAFASIQRNMATGAGDDVAIVMFSGHGTVGDDGFYFLPYDIDASTPATLEASAIPAKEFQAEIAGLAEHGRVLLLVDACRSGAMTADGSKLSTKVDLPHLLSQDRVTVLTSSMANELSYENSEWANGAFTKVLLEGLGGPADLNNSGTVSVGELAAYMAANLPVLTGGNQHPGVQLRFQSEIFVSGL